MFFRLTHYSSTQCIMHQVGYAMKCPVYPLFITNLADIPMVYLPILSKLVIHHLHPILYNIIYIYGLSHYTSSFRGKLYSPYPIIGFEARTGEASLGKDIVGLSWEALAAATWGSRGQQWWGPRAPRVTFKMALPPIGSKLWFKHQKWDQMKGFTEFHHENWIKLRYMGVEETEKWDIDTPKMMI